MAGAPSAWTVYDKFKNELGNKTIDLSGDTFKVALFTSSSDCGNKAHSTAKYSDFTNEVSNANGYTTGGASAGAGAFTDSSGTETFTIANVSWTASGAGITCRFAVVYDSTDSNKRAVAFSILDSTPANVVIPSGTILTLILGDIGALL